MSDLRGFLLKIEADLKAVHELGIVLAICLNDAAASGLTPDEGRGVLRVLHFQGDAIDRIDQAWDEADKATQPREGAARA